MGLKLRTTGDRVSHGTARRRGGSGADATDNLTITLMCWQEVAVQPQVGWYMTALVADEMSVSW